MCATLFLSGCGGGGGQSEVDPRVMFLNASADAGALTLRLNDQDRFAGVPYPSATSGFTSVDFEGPNVDGYDVSLHDATTGAEFDRQAIVFNRDTDNVVLAFGVRSFAIGEEIKRLRLKSFTVDRRRPVANKSRLIVVAAYERGPGEMTPAVRFRTPGDTPLFTTNALNPGDTGAILIDSGTQTWLVRRDQTDTDILQQDLTFSAGGVYLVVVSGIEADPATPRRPRVTVIPLPTTL